MYYQFENGTEAGKPYMAALAYGEAYEVASPEIQGFHPDQEIVQGVMDEDSKNIIASTVIYQPSSGTSYTVRHHLQLLGESLDEGDDRDLSKYELVFEENLNATTGLTVTVEPQGV